MLSKRENQVATLVATGDTTKEICEKLHISPHTVNKTRANIYEKLGVRNVGELSTWWFCLKFNISHADVELKVTPPSPTSCARVFEFLPLHQKEYGKAECSREASIFGVV